LRKRTQRGHTLLEVIVSLTIFGTFLAIAFGLTAEMRRWEKRLPVNFMRHPQIIAVIARMRRDVQDVEISQNQPIYVDEHDGYVNGPKTLVIQVGLKSGSQIVVWDFSEPGVVRRISYNVGVKTEWVARGVPPAFSFGTKIEAVKFEGRPYGVRLMAKDTNGRLAIDQILQPRSYE
jgi:prepilin-type N-terminal cleavage/methylation domain-containing protein